MPTILLASSSHQALESLAPPLRHAGHDLVIVQSDVGVRVALEVHQDLALVILDVDLQPTGCISEVLDQLEDDEGDLRVPVVFIGGATVHPRTGTFAVVRAPQLNARELLAIVEELASLGRR